MIIKTTKNQSAACDHFGHSSHVDHLAPVSSSTKFGDTIWDMHEFAYLPGLKSSYSYWDFNLIAGQINEFALSIAEYAYARMYKPTISHDKMGEWLTVQNEMNVLKDFAKFCHNLNLTNFSNVDTIVCKEYLNFLKINTNTSNERVHYRFSIIYRFWEYRHSISNPIIEIPFGHSFHSLFGKIKKSSENRTKVIPEEIFGPLMSTSIDYINVYSDSILKAWDYANNTLHNFVSSFGTISPTKRVRERYLHKNVSEYLIKNKLHTGRRLNCQGLRDLDSEVISLSTACMITILAFSGMRSSELLSLEHGCTRLESIDGGRKRYSIKAKLYKHRGTGSVDSWVIIEEVYKAVMILEHLTKRVREQTGDNRLIISDGTRSFLSINKSFKSSNLDVLTFDAVVYRINRYVDYCNTYLNGPSIPHWVNENLKSGPWRFNTRQFRRTLARYIARQPFGLIAGMLQFKHLDVTVFEGYAGSEPAWNQMLSEEKVLARINILDEIAIDLSSGSIAGGYGAKLKHDFEFEFRGRAEDYPPSKIAQWLSSKNKNLYVGKFNFCFFDASKALCNSAAITMDKPILNSCSPDKCSNACIANRHRPLWVNQLRQAEELSQHVNASEYQKIALNREIIEIKSLIENIDRTEV